MPARCPSCNQIYTDETLSFCPNDGTPLIKEPQQYNPQEIKPPTAYPVSASPAAYPPPPQQQQGYYAPQGGQAPPQGWQQPPYGQQQYPPQYGAPAVGKSKLPLIIAIAAVVLIGGGIGLFFLLKGNSSTSSTSSNSSNSSTSSNSSRVNTNSSSTNTSSTPSRTTSTFPTPSTTTTSSSSYSDDEKHKLFQAAGITQDRALITEVAQKLGLFDSSGQPTSAFQPFVREHLEWAVKNAAWVQEYRDTAKARAYVMAHK